MKPKKITWTSFYCSIYTHLRIVQSRRNDLESIGFILLYFIRGNYLLNILNVNLMKKLEKIGNKKEYTSIDELFSQFQEKIKIRFQL